MKKIILFVILFAVGCARAPIKERSQAMRKVEKIPVLQDDLSYQSLIDGLRANLDFIRQSSRVPHEMTFGPQRVSKKKYIESVEVLIQNSTDFESFKRNLKEGFDFYEVYGNEDWSQMKATSYYTPVLRGSKKPTKKLNQALYATPDDMILIDIDAYAEDFPKWRTFKETILEQRSQSSTARGRLLVDKSGNTKVVPYFKREEIDGVKESPLRKELALAYVDPIQAFFLQVQGSGVVEFEDGEKVTMGYASQNGHPYYAIGNKLLDKIPKEKMSLQTIDAHLRTLPLAEMQKILNANPSYVFFQKTIGRPKTYLGTEVVDGRTVATDQALFPKGALAFLEYEKPIFDSATATEPVRWQPSARFVIDQDTGGAIKGPGRLDIYAGEGSEAEQFAGVMKNPAKLYYLVPKDQAN